MVTSVVAATSLPATTQAAEAGWPTGPFTNALIVPVENEITDVTLRGVRRRFEQARAEGTPLVIIELDTPGGSLMPTLEICKLVKEMRDDGVRVYAWINKDAYSGGTIIALATDGIVMARNATIGDCQPIMLAPGGAAPLPKGIEAKATSPLLAELRDSARRNRYPLNMVMALIRPEMELFWVENTETGERRFVNGAERDELFGLAGGSSSSGQDAGEPGVGSTSQPVSSKKSRTAWRYVQQTPELEKVVQPVVDSRSLLTMRTPEAIAYGFAIGTVGDQHELKAAFHVTGAVTKLETTAMEKFVAWLASPMVRGVLFLLMLLGAYTEFQTPGLGVPGAVALVALVLFLGAPYLAGYTVTWEIVVIVVGILLLAIEIFVIPGFGVAGVAGIILIFVGIILSFVPAEPGYGPDDWFHLPSLPETYHYLQKGLLSIAGGLTGALIGMALLARYLPRVPVASRLVLENPRHDQVQMDDFYEGKVSIGDVGVVEGLLRPAGKARFGDTLVDVVSEGAFIQPGTRVKVAERKGNRVVVRPVEDESSE